MNLYGKLIKSPTYMFSILLKKPQMLHLKANCDHIQ